MKEQLCGRYWLIFESDLDYSPDAGTELLSPISYALQRVILLHRENPTYRYWAPVAAATHRFKMVLFTASSRNNFVGGTCTPPSALLVFFDLQSVPSVTRDAGYLHVNFELGIGTGVGQMDWRTDRREAVSSAASHREGSVTSQPVGPGTLELAKHAALHDAATWRINGSDMIPSFPCRAMPSIFKVTRTRL